MTHCMRCTSPASCDVWGCVPGTFSSEKVDPNPPPLTPGQQAILDAIPLREPGPFDLSTRTVPAAPPSTLSLEKIQALLDSTPPEPFGEWMRQQGFPPETSVLFLPETMRGELPSFAWPRYVQFSLDVGTPMLMRDVRGPMATVDQIWRGMVP